MLINRKAVRVMVASKGLKKPSGKHSIYAGMDKVLSEFLDKLCKVSIEKGSKKLDRDIVIHNIPFDVD